jgi:hypothetical protein
MLKYMASIQNLLLSIIENQYPEQKPTNLLLHRRKLNLPPVTLKLKSFSLDKAHLKIW